MTRSLFPCEHHPIDEECIHMDISLCYTRPSSPKTRDFEFAMSSNQPETETLTSPADELFYKGNLLPLHLPPRLQMVQDLLTGPGRKFSDRFAYDSVATTPFESCNVSPYASRELNPEDGGFDDVSMEIIEQSHSKTSLLRKLKLITQSKAYLKLKSLFDKTGCSRCEPCEHPRSKNGGKSNTSGRTNKRERCLSNNGSASFSGYVNHRSSSNKPSNSTSTSCSSSNSSSFSSVDSEVASSIQGAIAYCKESQQLACGRKSALLDECERQE